MPTPTPRLIGPDFIDIQIADLDAARSFYEGVLGLPVHPQGPPDAVVFAPKDGPFGRYFAFRDPFGYTITAHTAVAT